MIVITTASGRLGRAVALALEKRVSPGSVRLAARSPEKIQDLAARGFDVVEAAYANAASFDRAFAGADAALLISGEGANDVRGPQHIAAIDAARRAGVRHVAYTSVINPTPTTRFAWAGSHAATEAHLQQSGLRYTLLRDNMYAANLDASIAHAVQTGVLAMPGAAGKVSYVLHQDVAAAAAAVLTNDDGESRAYDITGPESLDAFDIAAELSQALGRSIVAVDPTPDAYAAELRSAGLPQWYVDLLLSIFAATAAGEYAAVSNDVARLIGRPGISARDHIRSVARRQHDRLAA